MKKTVLITLAKEKFLRKEISSPQRCKEEIRKILLKEGYGVRVLYLRKDDFKNYASLKQKIVALNPLCVFNLFEGFSDSPQSEADFVSILEEIKIPFSGNKSSVLRLCLDKFKTKNILRRNKLPTPKGILVKKMEDLRKLNLKFPLFVKPSSEDASVGIDNSSFIKDRDSLFEVIKKKLRKHPRGLIIEEFMGGREYNVAFLGKYPYQCLGVAVLDYSVYPEYPPFLSYVSKWDGRYKAYRFLVPSPHYKIPLNLKRRIIHLARQAGRVLGLEGYFRVDLREDEEGKIFILEVNPNPDISPESGFIRQAQVKGYSYKEIILRILKEVLDG